MKSVCSLGGIVDVERPGQGLMDIKKAGFQALMCDLSMFFGGYGLENIGASPVRARQRLSLSDALEQMYAYVETLWQKSKEQGLDVPVAAVPRLAYHTERGDFNGLLQALAFQSVKACGRIGCHALIVPPLFVGIPRENLWEANREYYLCLAKQAAKDHVDILLQNQCRDVNGHLVRGLCSGGGEAAEWVDRLNGEAGEERFGFCMDVGTCNLCGQNMHDFLHALGPRAKAVILRDNDGSRDNAMLPFTAVNKGTSQTDWLNLVRGLREIGYDGFLILDMSDTAAAVSPLLKPGLLCYARSVMDYFKWQIEMEGLLNQYPSRVLFGAGNMCRNYMKCYGEQYPPLYTCDNNSALWGTEFCGLAVKKPEALKELPPDTAVFICNVYYREIEAQLRRMGLENPIAFFNDEYMPSFYLDRL